MDIFQEKSFLNKVVFVAGGSTGINFEIARRFAELGAAVGLISRNAERVAHAVQVLQSVGAQAVGWATDVREYDAVAASLASTRKAFGPIDIVISGAAGNFLAPVLGLSSNAFRTVVDIDLIGTFNVFRASFDHLRKPGASLISISAPLARRPVLYQAHASAAKAGVNSLTMSLAMEWGPAGVRVNGISPGPISDTLGMSRLAPSPAATAALKLQLPLRDYGTKRDIADAAVFLASDNARYVTGTILDCDGGTVLGDASGDALTIPSRER
jgi:NAD(P)-dependent dehydrogenase (short-subunit alcohol dehydrogenase family)